MFSHASPLQAGLAAIVGLSFWAMSFSYGCSSDGCIGVIYPLGGGVIALLVQLFILVPVDAIRTRKRGEPFGLRMAGWVGLSVAAFILPLLFASL
ncbi:MAG TPA: hypothetical protein VM759_10960 [Longimicrobium sp.]|nr:hypothetical protein [Longimicrobium sp.]